MIPAGAIPDVTFEARRAARDPSPLRTDVAGFCGPLRRGPIGKLVRVIGQADLRRTFGQSDTLGTTGHALSGYFDNGGEI